MRPIFSLIHLSDLHFGSSLWNSERWFHRLAAATPIHGLYTHDFQVAHALANAVNKLLWERQQEQIPTLVVHTGDLTATGRPAQFSVGITYVRGRHLLSSGISVGLNQSNAVDIPGNHDIWQRNNPRNGASCRDYYSGPFPLEFRLPAGEQAIVLYGLDSNRADTLQHWLANGELDDPQLTDVCNRLEKDPSPRNVRIVALHHPLCDPPGTSDKPLHSRLNHREKVARRLREAGAELVLAGHVHQAFEVAPSDARPRHSVAGTGCQMSSPCSFNLVDIYAKDEKPEFHWRKLELAPETLQFQLAG